VGEIQEERLAAMVADVLDCLFGVTLRQCLLLNGLFDDLAVAQQRTVERIYLDFGPCTPLMAACR
jgi:hypothetical protein